MGRWPAWTATARDAAFTALWFGFGTLMYLAGFHMLFASDHEASDALGAHFGVLVLVCALLMVRRRAPVAAMVAGLVPLALDLFLGPTVPVWIVYTELIYAAVVYGSRPQMQVTVVTWLALSVTAAGAVLVVTGSWRFLILALVIAAAFVGTVLGWGLTVRAHKDTAEAERARRRAMSLVAELDRRAAVADERKAMARDLHDVIAGHLSAIALQSEAALAGHQRPGTDERLTGILTAVRSNSIEALQEMRTMIGLLRHDDAAGADPVDDTAAPGRLAQLTHLVTAARHSGMQVRLRHDTEGPAPAGAVDQTAYRIIQEAVTNAMKHAPGETVDIDIHSEDTTLVVAVRNRLLSRAVTEPGDTGASATAHRGLINMRERAVALGGEFGAGPESGVWSVLARLPLSATPATQSAGESR